MNRNTTVQLCSNVSSKKHADYKPAVSACCAAFKRYCHFKLAVPRMADSSVKIAKSRESKDV